MESSPEEREELLSLCRSHGIGTGYHDIWGTHRAVPERGLRALLRAMGVAAQDREQVRASLRQAEEARAREAGRLPPVAVLLEDERPWSLEAAGPADGPPRRWLLTEEGGAVHEGLTDGGCLRLPESLPAGYHRLQLEGDAAGADGARESTALVVVAPRRCYAPPALAQGGRLWGPALQLYALRSERNWGIGDFTDLAKVVRICARAGAALIGLNPLHALYPDNPEHASPYSPSSRRFGNPLYLDVEEVPEFARCAEARAAVGAAAFQARLRELRAAEMVDYRGVAGAKLPVLRMLYREFLRALRQGEAATRAGGFRAFQAGAGPALRRHALFEALQAHFRERDASVWGWPCWPAPYRDPASPETAAFLDEHLEEVEFHEYLQWLIDEQLAAAGSVSVDCGLPVGLYMDLAVSIDRGGAESWSAQELYAQGAGAGCPPDDFNLHGQDWGLLPLLPEALRRSAHAPFIATLRACMGHAGALRVDHVMGLARLFWVPPGELPEAGAYVAYPFEELLGILALESCRNRCLVIGEDLGTVPDEVRAAMHRGGMLSYRVLYFSHRPDGEFLAPGEFASEALVTSTTHDLATFAGWWEGRDLHLRRALHLFPSEALCAQQFEERERDRARLLAALRSEGLLPQEGGAAPPAEALAAGVQQYLARTPAQVLTVQLEDVFGCRDQVNLPGTVEQYANWRRKLPVPIEQWRADGRLDELARRMAAEGRG
jgi:(1->4)-alpha-D-glucan 1-alpha-D-glucosylmutase